MIIYYLNFDYAVYNHVIKYIMKAIYVYGIIVTISTLAVLT